MKTFAGAAVLVAAVMQVNGQGTVDFNNLYDYPNRSIINGLTGLPVTADDGVVAQLYWSKQEDGPFQPAGTTVPVGVFGVFLTPGFFGGGEVRMDALFPPGSAAYFDVRAWELTYGASYEEAVAAPAMNGRLALRGTSPRFFSDTGNPVSPGVPDLPTDLGPQIQSFVVNVPEPETTFLLLNGALILLSTFIRGAVRRFP